MSIQRMNEREEVKGFFEIETISLEYTTSDNPKPYLLLGLLSSDTKRINGKYWEVSDKQKIEFSRNEIVYIEGLTKRWRNIMEINIKRIRKATPEELKQMNCDHANKQIDGTKLFKSFLASIKHKELRLICEFCFTKVEDKIQQLLTNSSREIYRIQTLYKQVDFLANNYSDVNIDMIKSGIVIKELANISLKDTSEPTKTKGKLLGNTGIALEWITEASLFCGFSLEEDFVIGLKHLILSQTSVYIQSKTHEAYWYESINFLCDKFLLIDGRE
jgi:3'-5' exoribonuclease